MLRCAFSAALAAVLIPLGACRGAGQDSLGYELNKDYRVAEAADGPGQPAPEVGIEGSGPALPGLGTGATKYTVAQGDTLYQISQRLLGTGRRWQEIAQLNALDDAKVRRLYVGQVLKIPAR